MFTKRSQQLSKRLYSPLGLVASQSLNKLQRLTLKHNNNHIRTTLGINLMTSRELTSGFDFWSRGHLRMAVMHLPVKFGADIFIQCGVIDIFPKLKMEPPPSWICWGSHGTTHEGTLVVRTPC